MYVKEYYAHKARKWKSMDQDKRDNSANILWESLDLNSKKEVLKWSGYGDKYADMSYKDLTPEMHEMIKYVFLH